MICFSSTQLDGFRGYMLDKKADAFLASLLLDFRRKLADYDITELRGEVRSLTRQFFALGFRDGQHLYRLVAWGIFLGSDFLETHCDGMLIEIARKEVSETERFSLIRAMLLKDAQSAAARDDWPLPQ